MPPVFEAPRCLAATAAGRPEPYRSQFLTVPTLDGGVPLLVAELPAFDRTATQSESIGIGFHPPPAEAHRQPPRADRPERWNREAVRRIPSIGRPPEKVPPGAGVCSQGVEHPRFARRSPARLAATACSARSTAPSADQLERPSRLSRSHSWLSALLQPPRVSLANRPAGLHSQPDRHPWRPSAW